MSNVSCTVFIIDILTEQGYNRTKMILCSTINSRLLYYRVKRKASYRAIVILLRPFFFLCPTDWKCLECVDNVLTSLVDPI